MIHTCREQRKLIALIPSLQRYIFNGFCNLVKILLNSDTIDSDVQGIVF